MAGIQVNLPFSYSRSKGTSPPPHQPETRSHTTRERLFVRSPNRKSTSCAFYLFAFHLLHLHTPSQPKGTTTLPSLQSLFVQTTMEPLPHGLWSCSSKPLTGRTGHYRAEGRFSSTGTTGGDTTASTGISPTTGQGLVATTTCLVGTPSIEATTTSAPATGTTRHHLANQPCRRLRIAHPLDTNDISPGHPLF